MFKPEIDAKGKKVIEENPREHPVSENSSRLKFKVRFDYKGIPRPARFFWGGKKTEEVAQEIREHQVSLWRNIPLQGIYIEDIDLGEIYRIYDEDLEEEVAFAPLELMICADSLEDLLRFVVREEFRRIEILEPPSLRLTNKEIERLLFKINEMLQKKIFPRQKDNPR